MACSDVGADATDRGWMDAGGGPPPQGGRTRRGAPELEEDCSRVPSVPPHRRAVPAPVAEGPRLAATGCAQKPPPARPSASRRWPANRALRFRVVPCCAASGRLRTRRLRGRAGIVIPFRAKWCSRPHSVRRLVRDAPSHRATRLLCFPRYCARALSRGRGRRRRTASSRSACDRASTSGQTSPPASPGAWGSSAVSAGSTIWTQASRRARGIRRKTRCWSASTLGLATSGS